MKSSQTIMTSVLQCKSENDNYSTNYQSESYIKEEIMLPDMTDCFEYGDSSAVSTIQQIDQISPERLYRNKNELTCIEQICNPYDTHSDEEIDVVNIDEIKEKLFIEAHKNRNIIGNVELNNSKTDNYDNNDKENIMPDEKKCKKSQKQTTTPNFSRRSLLDSTKLFPVTSENKDTSETTSKSFKVKRSVIQIKQYECPKCGKKLKRKICMLRHEKRCGRVVNVRYFSCKFCHFVTKYKYSIENHMKKIHKLKPRQCASIIKSIIEEGDKMKDSTNGIQVNVASRTTAYRKLIQLHCTKCNETCKYVDHEKERKCRKCGTAMLLQCIKCSKLSPKLPTMYAHLNYKCAAKNRYQCADCDYTSTRKQCIMDHIGRMHTLVATEDYEKCSKCNKLYKHRANRIIHEKDCGKKLVLQCSHCSFQSKNKVFFNRHMQDHILHPNAHDTATSVATNDVPIEADKAEKSLNRKEELKVQKLMKFLCPKCDKSIKYVKWSDRKCHKCRTKLRYLCSKCHKVYSVLYDTRLHIISNHLSGELKQRTQCTKCGKCFACYKNLLVHKNSCIKQPDLQCEHCHFRTMRRKYIVQHLQRTHCESTTADSSKLLACAQCGKSYCTERGLRDHVQFYCGKLLACNHCRFKANRKSGLIIHLKALHNDLFTGQKLWCKHCGKKSSNVYTHNCHVANCRFK